MQGGDALGLGVDGVRGGQGHGGRGVSDGREGSGAGPGVGVAQRSGRQQLRGSAVSAAQDEGKSYLQLQTKKLNLSNNSLSHA